MKRIVGRLCAFVAVALLFPLEAAASDGRIEINQAKAVAGGVVPGDSALFPVTIDRRGSYVLTGDLDVRTQATPENVTAIHFVGGSEGSTLDLNGFNLIGPKIGCAPVCNTGSGSGNGIEIDVNFVSVSNGTIRGFGQLGLEADSVGGGTIERVLSLENRTYGFRSSGHRLTYCEATFNGGIGFVLTYSTVVDSRAVANQFHGFNLTESVAERATSYGNSSHGFSLLASSTLFHGRAIGNVLGSIACFSGSGIGGTALDSATIGACNSLGPNLCNGVVCP